MKKVVVKEKASKDVFTDLSREMFDWQWPAVYKKTSVTKQQNNPIGMLTSIQLRLTASLYHEDSGII